MLIKTMSIKKALQKNFLFLTVGLTASVSVLAAPMQLSVPQPGDLTTKQLGSTAATALQNTNREVVHFSWAVSGKIDQKAASKPYVGESRGYWMQVSDVELSKGVDIFTSAPGSVVKITPQAGSAAIDPVDMELRDSRGGIFRGSEAMDLVVGDAQMRASGTPFPRGTSAFRVSAKRTPGHYTLHAASLKSTGKQRYHIHVQETNSDVVLQMQANADTYLYGQAIDAHSSLKNSQQALPIDKVKGYMLSPDGAVLPMNFKRSKKGTFAVSLPLTQQAAAAPGLWEVHTEVEGRVNGVKVLRHVKTAFNYVIPQARLTGDLAVNTQANGDVSAVLAMDVASEGRYELRGTLYGTDAQGAQQAFMVANTAGWLNQGNGELSLVFDNTLLQKSGLTSPYEVRDLRLMDQSRMGVLHRQAQGFKFTH